MILNKRHNYDSMNIDDLLSNNIDFLLRACGLANENDKYVALITWQKLISAEVNRVRQANYADEAQREERIKKLRAKASEITGSSDSLEIMKTINNGTLFLFLQEFVGLLAETEGDFEKALQWFYSLIENHGLVLHDKGIEGTEISSSKLIDALRQSENEKKLLLNERVEKVLSDYKLERIKLSDYKLKIIELSVLNELNESFNYWESLQMEARYKVYRDDVAKAYQNAGKFSFPWHDIYNEYLVWLDVSKLLQYPSESHVENFVSFITNNNSPVKTEPAKEDGLKKSKRDKTEKVYTSRLIWIEDKNVDTKTLAKNDIYKFLNNSGDPLWNITYLTFDTEFWQPYAKETGQQKPRGRPKKIKCRDCG